MKAKAKAKKPVRNVRKSPKRAVRPRQGEDRMILMRHFAIVVRQEVAEALAAGAGVQGATGATGAPGINERDLVRVLGGFVGTEVKIVELREQLAVQASHVRRLLAEKSVLVATIRDIGERLSATCIALARANGELSELRKASR